MYLQNSSVHTKSYILDIGHQNICGAAGSAPQFRTSARRGATVVDAGGCCDNKRRSFMRREAGGKGCFSREENKIMLRILKNLHVVIRASGSGVPDTFPSWLRRSGPYRRAGSQHWHLVRLRRRKGCPRMLL